MTNWVTMLRVRTQLMLLMGLATSIALIIAGSVVVWSDYRFGREALLKRLTIQAAITARSSAAVLAFDDVSAAMKTLESLKADQAILRVTLTRADGSVFAQHAFEADGARDANVVDVTADVLLPQRIGRLQVRGTTLELNRALNREILILSAMLATTWLLTLAASAWLQRIVSKPIATLAGAAARVAASRDFGFRVTAAGSKELHDLVTAFNQMLADLQSSADQLATHQAGLEGQVIARTAELASALKVAQQAALAKVEFLANMSHEIRTPMNGVIGMLDLLYDENLPVESKSMLDIARNSADSMLLLINDILDFSKIDAGRLTLEDVEFELRPLAEEVASLFTQQAHGKGVELICAIHNEVPPFVSGDPTRLRQIMANLMGNAVKFTERGEVLLGVRFRARPGSNEGMLQVIVRDTGIGMTKATLRTLFTEFTQADSSTTRKYGGTGLGLAISKRVVDAMGGVFGVRSRLRQGTTFTVNIPMKRVAACGSGARRQLAGLKCLIVDDNATNRGVLQHYLQHEAINYQSESSAIAGLTALRRAAGEGVPYDLVLLDYQMPDMDGIAFIRQLRQERSISTTKCIVLTFLGSQVPDADDLDIVAMTANALSGDRERCLAAGMDEYVSKPIRRDALVPFRSSPAGSRRRRRLRCPYPSVCNGPAPTVGVSSTGMQCTIAPTYPRGMRCEPMFNKSLRSAQ